MCPIRIFGFGNCDEVGTVEDGLYAIDGEEFAGEGRGAGGAPGGEFDGSGVSGREDGRAGDEFKGIGVGGGCGLDEEGAVE